MGAAKNFVVLLCSFGLTIGYSAVVSAYDTVFGQTKLAVFRLEADGTGTIVGCFPHESGEGAYAKCVPPFKEGTSLDPMVFLNGKIMDSVKFKYLPFKGNLQHIAHFSTSKGQGFVADRETLNEYKELVRQAKKRGNYRSIPKPKSWKEIGIIGGRPFPERIDAYDLDRDKIQEFLFLRPVTEADHDGTILIHEPTQNRWVVFDSGCY